MVSVYSTSRTYLQKNKDETIAKSKAGSTLKTRNKITYVRSCIEGKECSPKRVQ